MLLKCQQLKLSITLKVQLTYLTNLYPNKYLVNCLSCRTIDSFDSYNIFNCHLWNKNIQYTHTHTHTPTLSVTVPCATYFRCPVPNIVTHSIHTLLLGTYQVVRGKRACGPWLVHFATRTNK